jgi:hypothetical protein
LNGRDGCGHLQREAIEHGSLRKETPGEIARSYE